MTTLTVFPEAGGEPLDVTTDPARIAELAHGIGGFFERWSAAVDLDASAGQDEILAAYAADIERIKARGGYVTADVVRIKPDHPDRVAIRAKFLAEHTHAEDEVRFFVEGEGDFYLHAGDKVIKIACERGDLVGVPAGLKHWYDAREFPDFAAIRIFTNPAGWVATFTGEAIATEFVKL